MIVLTTDGFEQAQRIVFGSASLGFIVAEGEIVRSCEELVQLAIRDERKDKKMLNLLLFKAAVDGR